jgi:hypothetical protein
MQIDFLLTKPQGLALHWRRPTHKAFELHAQNTDIKIQTRRFIKGGQHQVVKVVNHAQTPGLLN